MSRIDSSKLLLVTSVVFVAAAVIVALIIASSWGAGDLVKMHRLQFVIHPLRVLAVACPLTALAAIMISLRRKPRTTLARGALFASFVATMMTVVSYILLARMP